MEYAYRYGELNDKYAENFKLKAMDTIKYMSKTIDDFKNFFLPNKKEEQFFLEDAVSQALAMLSAQLKNNNIEDIFWHKDAKKHEVCL